MLIRSQNKEEIVMMEAITRLYLDGLDNSTIFANLNNGETINLGRYYSTEDAVKVFDKIQAALMNNMSFSMPEKNWIC